MELDSNEGTIRLPADKLWDLKAQLRIWWTRIACRKWELLSLLGLLNHACKAIRAGRAFYVLSLCFPTGRVPSDGDSNSTSRITARSTPRHSEPRCGTLFFQGTSNSNTQDIPGRSEALLGVLRTGNNSPTPGIEKQTVSLVTVLANNGIAHSTIKVYLSATRQLHITKGLPEPRMEKMPRLSQVLRGIRTTQPTKVYEAADNPCMEFCYGLKKTGKRTGG